MGWKKDRIRDAAVAAARRQKAEAAAARKEWRVAAARANVTNIANEILEAAAVNANSVQAPAHENVVHVTPALKEAGRAVNGDFAPPTEEEAAKLRAASVEAMKTRWRIPESDMDKYNECRRIDALMARDESAVSFEQANWSKSWKNSSTFKTFDRILGEEAKRKWLEGLEREREARQG
jgi:hypothetical protein